MIETLIAVGIVVVVLIVAVLGYAATKPDAFCVQRSASIHASTACVP